MSSVLNKSNHPVVVKKIPIKVWALRQEIEAAIKQKIEENNGNTENIDISDIQNFYTMEYEPEAESDEESKEDGDDSADEMLKAMQEAGDDAGDSEESSEDNNEETTDEEKSSESDEEAQKLADEVLDSKDGDHDEARANEFKRVFPDENINNGFMFLSDLNMQEALVFTRETYTTGSNIVIELGVTRPFTLCAEVISSFSVNRNSRVISEQKPNFRLQTKLQFKFPGERTNLRDFLKSVEPPVPPPPSKLKKPAGDNEDDEDEFDDLGF